jgi:hypothetical protein
MIMRPDYYWVDFKLHFSDRNIMEITAQRRSLRKCPYLSRNVVVFEIKIAAHQIKDFQPPI